MRGLVSRLAWGPCKEPAGGVCVQQMRIATRRRPRHTLTLVWVAGRAVCLSPPDTTQGTVTKEGQGRATWHARTPSTLPMAGQRPKRWKREAAFVRSFVHDTRCARNMRAVAATRGWVGQQEGSSWQVKQQQKSVRKSPSPRSTYNGGGDGDGDDQGGGAEHGGGSFTGVFDAPPLPGRADSPVTPVTPRAAFAGSPRACARRRVRGSRSR